MPNKEKWYHENDGDRIWWLDNYPVIGEFIFSFDKRKQYNLYEDYPDRLSVKEWLVFNAENDYWYKYFKDRNDRYEKRTRAEIDSIVNG